MGELRRSRRAPHVGLRRHVPHQQLDVHLRPGVPRRARPSRRPSSCTAAAPTAPTSPARTTAATSRRWPSGSPPTSGSSASRRRSGAARSRSTGTATPSPAWSTAPASSSTGPSFPGGPGCALHRAALEAGERFMDWKPEVCWQLPLRRVDDTDAYGHVTSTVREWKRRDWGEGGEEFHWWCTDDPEAFVGHKPVYLEMRDELVELVGRKPYALLRRPRRGPHRGRGHGRHRQRLDHHLPPAPGGAEVAAPSPSCGRGAGGPARRAPACGCGWRRG